MLIRQQIERRVHAHDQRAVEQSLEGQVLYGASPRGLSTNGNKRWHLDLQELAGQAGIKDRFGASLSRR